MVSSGTVEDQKQEVAQVASLIFGKQFTTDQIVQEKLRPCFDASIGMPSKEELSRAVVANISEEQTAEALSKYPTAIWLELKIALQERERFLVRNKPLRLKDIVDALSEDSGQERSICEVHIHALMEWIAKVNLENRDSSQTYLPFRLHQFVSQTGSVYTTLDQMDKREITLEPSPFKIEDDKRKPLFPNVFSRVSGHAFICVSLNDETHMLEPREFADYSDESDENLNDGYLIEGDDVWDPESDLEQLPDTWLKINSKGNITGPHKQYAPRIPHRIYYDEEGRYSFDEPLAYEAWYMPSPLLFDPTSGTFFDTKTSESTKLAKLGSEGRSSSTTILSLSLLQQLARTGLSAADQKLLSFTDNRQDAALQAGHFNDFLDTVQLRAAVYKALLQAENSRLSYKNIGNAIYEALNLNILEYANTDVVPPAWKLNQYQDTFKKYLVYRTLYDLRRGWRVTLPNLEQCALLDIDYEHLDDVVTYDGMWADMLVLDRLTKEDRKTFLFQVLEFFRHSYAIYSETYLVPKVIDENFKEILENLKPPWKFEQKDIIPQPSHIRTVTLHPTNRMYTASAGPNSRLGKYVRWYVTQRISQASFKSKEYIEFMDMLLQKLEEADFLKSQSVRDRSGGNVKVYQLRLSNIIWTLGNKQSVRPDIVKCRAYKPISIPPNLFFQELYQIDFSKSKVLRAEDHTGQLQNEDRQQREEDFKTGKISALYCSPTMELGIDIRDLNIVHMRNAPPSPANYAQRSGRAGRSGQAALVFTFCSSYSPHDRHYFGNQPDIVAGVVTPPNIDLRNEELLRTHLNALYLSEIGLPELEDSIVKLVDESLDDLPLRFDRCCQNSNCKLGIRRFSRRGAPDSCHSGSDQSCAPGRAESLHCFRLSH